MFAHTFPCTYVLNYLHGSGNCTSFGGKVPPFQRSGAGIISIRMADFSYTGTEVEEVSEGPEFTLQVFLWSSLPKYLKRLQLVECQLTDSQITTLVKALDNHEAIEVSGRKGSNS